MNQTDSPIPTKTEQYRAGVAAMGPVTAASGITTMGVRRAHQRRAERRAATGQAIPRCDICTDERERTDASRRIPAAKFDVSVMAGPPLAASTLLVNYRVCGAHLVEAMDWALPVDVAANLVVTKLR